MGVINDFINQKLPPSPLIEVGIGSFTTLVRVREGYKLAADVPDIPVENGTSVNDHIILKPVTLSISGNVSDVHLVESPAIRVLKRAQAGIGNLTSRYAPAKTQAQLSKINAMLLTPLDAIGKIDDAIAVGAQALSFVGNKDKTAKTNRALFEEEMQRLHFSKQPFSISFPYKTFDNMVMTLISFDYDNESESTEFTLEAKEIKFAELKLVKIEKPSKGLGGQTGSKKEKGAQEGKAVEKSFMSNVSDYLKGKF